MSATQKQGLVKKQTLTEAEVTEIAQLLATCNAHEDLNLPISLDALRNRPGESANDFLYYEDGALVGYLSLDHLGRVEKEGTGMVYPNSRRRGIFRALFDAAKTECAQRGVEALILVCEQKSQAGQAFARAIKAQLDFSEHEMLLESFQDRYLEDERFSIHPATDADKEDMIAVFATDVGNLEDARQMVDHFYGKDGHTWYLAKMDEMPVGCLRREDQDGTTHIYGFVVRPDYRGHGYGRMMLEALIRAIQAEDVHPILLEVDTTNVTALGLYRSCGFRPITTYDYYRVSLT